MTERFSVIKLSFNNYGIWDNKQDIRTAWALDCNDFSQVNEYAEMLNSKYERVKK